ncbi:recombinase family protein [Nocardioides bigeumensis]|uniref:Recombinase family protein n=1 Tax=Nocardioides bigeumensis TaxID=433657 RepID=A0ABN2YSI5_9ACTN
MNDDAPRHLVGYARVSSGEHQRHDLQIDALIAAGVEPSNIFTDTISGASVAASRPGLSQALAHCGPNSTLVVWRIDRLGRSLVDVVSTVESLIERGVAVRSISDGIDPDTPHGRLLLNLLCSCAQFERDLIRARVQAGMDSARRRGVRFGRPAPDPVEVGAKVRMARRAMAEDGLPAADAARLVGWSRSTLYRHMQVIPA